jgi:hypothetical protein
MWATAPLAACGVCPAALACAASAVGRAAVQTLGLLCVCVSVFWCARTGRMNSAGLFESGVLLRLPAVARVWGLRAVCWICRRARLVGLWVVGRVKQWLCHQGLSEVQSKAGGGVHLAAFWCPFAQGRQEEEKAPIPTAYECVFGLRCVRLLAAVLIGTAPLVVSSGVISHPTFSHVTRVIHVLNSERNACALCRLFLWLLAAFLGWPFCLKNRAAFVLLQLALILERHTVGQVGSSSTLPVCAVCVAFRLVCARVWVLLVHII